MDCRKRTCLSLAVTVSLLVAGPVAAESGVGEREKAALAATGQLIKQLGGALKQHMSEGGPEAAIRVCSELAPGISGEISRANGWRMTRVSGRVRNPLLGMPDAWERKVLSDFESRVGKGENPADMSFSEVVEEGGTSYFRFMKAIGTKPVCLTCHGNEEIPEGVRKKLSTAYPMDRATGYRKGDLRGAVSIKQPMDIPLPAAMPAR